jgi:hypothetical protein
MKIRPAVAELFRADGQTGRTKVIDAFRNFANAPNNEQVMQNSRSLTYVFSEVMS